MCTTLKSLRDKRPSYVHGREGFVYTQCIVHNIHCTVHSVHCQNHRATVYNVEIIERRRLVFMVERVGRHALLPPAAASTILRAPPLFYNIASSQSANSLFFLSHLSLSLSGSENIFKVFQWIILLQFCYRGSSVKTPWNHRCVWHRRTLGKLLTMKMS